MCESLIALTLCYKTTVDNINNNGCLLLVSLIKLNIPTLQTDRQDIVIIIIFYSPRWKK